MPKGATPSGRQYAFDAGAAARELQQRGGFTRQRTTGQTPASGYMVSHHGTEKIVPGLASSGDIEAYRQAHTNPRARPRKYVGGWHEEGKTFLDQSQNVKSPRKAQELGQAHAQRAVYNIDRDKVQRVHHGGRVDVRDTLFEGHKEATGQLRIGNSDAVRQQKEIELHVASAAVKAKTNQPTPLLHERYQQRKMFR